MTKHAHTFLFLPYAGAAALAAFWLPNFLPERIHSTLRQRHGYARMVDCPGKRVKKG